MLFTSYTFWAFFAGVMLLYWRLPHRQQNIMLLIASYVFYGAWDWRFLSLIWISTLIDYIVALRIANERSAIARRRLLSISVVANLGLLGFFKYSGFFVTEFAALLQAAGISAHLPVLNVILPVGISFYTFQTMSYTIDVYRSDTKPCKSLLDFALYVCFFPQLVAGPIERSSHLLPQIEQPRRPRANDFREGLYHIAIGLFKKIVVADNLAVFANAIFNTPSSQLTGVECLVGVYAFAFQIYGDFSGYSSIAQGLAKWMGVDLMFNFRIPYLSLSPSDFWRRWHVSLSSWLRDYLYIPLGGNRGGKLATYRNLLLTMLLGGLWHGAAWTFIAWGAFHGAILIAYRPFEPRVARIARDRTAVGSRVAAAVIMFHLVCVSWLLFRAQTMPQAWEMFQLMVTDFRVTPLALTGLGMLVFFAAPLTLFEWWLERKADLVAPLRRRWTLRAVAYSYVAAMLVLFPPPSQNVFIYFQF